MKWNANFSAQVVVGALVGYVFYLIGGVAGVLVHCPRGGLYEEWGKVCVWGVVAYVIGVSVGVYLIGSALRQHGSLTLTVLGSILGGAAVMAFLLSPARVAACLLTSILSPVLATIGYHLRAATAVPQT